MAEDITGTAILLQREVIHDNDQHESAELLKLSKILLCFKMPNGNS